MIQIGEKDALWFFYKKAYFYSKEQLQPPGNLCNYFWTAVAGAAKTFFWETNIIIVFHVFAALMFCFYNLALYFEVFQEAPPLSKAFLGLPLIVGTIIFGGLAVLSVIARWFKYWNEKNVQVSNVSGVVLFIVGFSALLSIVFTDKEVGWNFWNLLYGFLALASTILFFFIVVGGYSLLFTNNTNLGKNILQYMSAVKNRVCPLVDPPQSFKDAEREKLMNCGDG